MDLVWRFVCGKAGARYVRQPVGLPVRAPDEVVRAIWSGLARRVRVLFFSHITSPTAAILPIEELARRAREAGIITVIDGVHAPGQAPLCLEAWGVDFCAGNCHKGL